MLVKIHQTREFRAQARHRTPKVICLNKTYYMCVKKSQVQVTRLAQKIVDLSLNFLSFFLARQEFDKSGGERREKCAPTVFLEIEAGTVRGGSGGSRMPGIKTSDTFRGAASRRLKIAGDLRHGKINERLRGRRRRRDSAVRQQQPRRGCRRLVRLPPHDPRQRTPRRVRAVSTSRGGSCKCTWRRDAVGPRGHGSLHRQGPLQGQDPAGAHEGSQTGERPTAVGNPDSPSSLRPSLLIATAACDAQAPLGSLDGGTAAPHLSLHSQAWTSPAPNDTRKLESR